MNRPTERIHPAALLAVASALSILLNMWMGRGLTFTSDELVWFMLAPDLDLSGAFHPYVGHLIATSKAFYWLVLELIGPDYRLIRLGACLTLVAVVWVLYLLLKRFSGAWPALGVSLVVLFFSGDPAHVFHGNGITVVLSVGCGLLALLLLTKPGGLRSVGACLALCLGLATYSQALPFLVAVTVFLLASRRFRELWVPVVPFLLYFLWWVWASDLPKASQNDLEPWRIIELPVWGFRATGALIENLLHLSTWPGGDVATVAGLILAALLIAGLVWLVHRNGVNPLFLAGAAALITMWALVVVVPVDDRDPDASRYMYPFLFASALVFGSLLKAGRTNRNLAVAGAAVVAFCCVTGVLALNDHADRHREGGTLALRASLTGVELAAPTDPTLTADDLVTEEQDFFLNLPFRAMDDLDLPSVASYTAAVEKYGRIGFESEEIPDLGPRARRLADRSMIRLSGLTPVELPDGTVRTPCRRPTFLIPGPPGIPLPSGRFQARNPTTKPVPLLVSGFSGTPTPIGQVPPGSAVSIGHPGDRSNPYLRLMARGSTLTLCRG